MDVHNIADVPAFTTKDGSEIRELLAHRNSCITQQSLAEARLAPGLQTTPHYHRLTEEIYYILEGTGVMRMAETDEHNVGPGDAIAIPPGAVHTIANTGNGVLKFLCTCAPAYEHDDTVLVEPE
ncbi:MAG: cupin domain-containing protein [Pirellulales bacterium]|nr:cupin domain-containing protein [Pirellulales bacterium]